MAISVTAALLIIGDEILTGRTKDKNIGYIAEYLTGIGIDLREVRVVPDVEEEIVAAVNALRSRYTYLFTTGGIGPTHDDITADCIAKAFGVGIDHDPRAVAMLQERYTPDELNEARLRMARIPNGASLIENPISKAPGFRIGNVHVMAGVPIIMRAMLEALAPTLKGGRKVLSVAIPAPIGEGAIGDAFGALQQRFPDVKMGSYPQMGSGKPSTELVLRCSDAARLAEAEAEVRAMVDAATARAALRN